MTDDAGLASKRVAVLGVSVLALLIGVILAVQVNSRPAYEATAEMVVEDGIGTFHSLPEDPDLADEVRILGSPRIADDAVSLAADLDGGVFAWYRHNLLDVPLPFDRFMILNSLRIEIDTDSHQILVHFRADDPTVAQVGANLVVEAYRQLRPQLHFAVCDPAERRPCPPLDPITVSASFAPTPRNRIDRPDLADVMLYVLGSMLVGYLTWRWWPTAVREETG